MQFSHTIQLFQCDPVLVGDMQDAIIALDEAFRINFWNEGAERTFGYSRSHAIGSTFENILAPNKFDIKVTAITRELNYGQEWRGEIIHRRRDESLICCLVSISKQKREGSGDQYLLISRDVSERKLENLQRLNEMLDMQLNSKTIDRRQFFNRRNDSFFLVDKHWNFTVVNKKAAEMAGRHPDSLLGKHLWTEFPQGNNTIFSKAFHLASDTQQYLHFEDFYEDLNCWFQVDIYPSPEGLTIFLHDLSEERESDEQLRESEELYRRIVESAEEGIWMIDATGLTTFVNASMAKMLGYDREEILGREFGEFLSSDSKKIAANIMKARRASARQDASLTTNEGKNKWVMLNTSPIFKNDEYAGILAMVTDISERRSKEQELKESHQQLRNLASRLQNIREEERASLAREIHDELGQQLTALKLDIYSLYRNLPKDDLKLKAKAEAILTLVNETLPRIEKKAIELHPSLLHDLGLLAAIEWQNAQFQSRNEASVNFTASGSDAELPNEVATALYRIYQEALTNVTRHARASVINTTFTQNQNGIELTIADNGKGFDPNRMDKRKSLGLLSMKERCIVIGGKCEITSIPEKGTTVSVTVPFVNVLDNSR